MQQITKLFITLTLLLIPAAASAQSWPNVDGQWAQLQVTTSVNDIPIVGEVETRTIAYMLLEIDQEGSALEVTSKVCDIEIDSEIDKVRSVIPPAMIDAIGVKKRRARLERTKDGKVRFFQPRSTDLLGVKLDKLTDPLPTEIDDPRVFDADSDGNPGVTVKIEGMIDGAVYVVQKSWNILRGLADMTRIDGEVTWKTSQEVLDATSVLLNSNPNARPHPDRSKHYFRTTRIGSNLGCHDILKRRKALFAR